MEFAIHQTNSNSRLRLSCECKDHSLCKALYMLSCPLGGLGCQCEHDDRDDNQDKKDERKKQARKPRNYDPSCHRQG